MEILRIAEAQMKKGILIKKNRCNIGLVTMLLFPYSHCPALRQLKFYIELTEWLDTSKISYEVSKCIGGEILRIIRILVD